MYCSYLATLFALYCTVVLAIDECTFSTYFQHPRSKFKTFVCFDCFQSAFAAFVVGLHDRLIVLIVSIIPLMLVLGSTQQWHDWKLTRQSSPFKLILDRTGFTTQYQVLCAAADSLCTLCRNRRTYICVKYTSAEPDFIEGVSSGLMM